MHQSHQQEAVMKDRKQDDYIFLGLLIIPVIWFAILIAPYSSGGLIYSLPYISEAINHPFSFSWCDNTPRMILIFTLIYAIGVMVYLSTMKNYRRTVEYGSAKWANALNVNRKYASKNYLENKLLSQNVRIGLNGKIHRRNLNTIVIGGSGAGKTRFYCKPNIMQCNTSFVVLDPNGYNIRG